MQFNKYTYIHTYLHIIYIYTYLHTYIHACIIHDITAVHQPTMTHINSKEIQKVVTVEVTVWLLWYRLGWDGVIHFVAGLPMGSSKIPRNWEYLWAFGRSEHKTACVGVLGSHDAWPTDVTASPPDWVEQ